VPLADGVGLIHCPTGAIGSKACLFWYRTLADFFGGICFVIAVDSRGNTVQLPADTYDRTLRAVEFLGAADDAVPRLQHLISGQMRFVAEEPSQMSLKLH
jgi:hypothetical protein